MCGWRSRWYRGCCCRVIAAGNQIIYVTDSQDCNAHVLLPLSILLPVPACRCNCKTRTRRNACAKTDAVYLSSLAKGGCSTGCRQRVRDGEVHLTVKRKSERTPIERLFSPLRTHTSLPLPPATMFHLLSIPPLPPNPVAHWKRERETSAAGRENLSLLYRMSHRPHPPRRHFC